MKVRVLVFENVRHLCAFTGGPADDPIIDYTMNHDDSTERRRLGQSCVDAFAAGQCVVTYPVAN